MKKYKMKQEQMSSANGDCVSLCHGSGCVCTKQTCACAQQVTSSCHKHNNHFSQFCLILLMYHTPCHFSRWFFLIDHSFWNEQNFINFSEVIDESNVYDSGCDNFREEHIKAWKYDRHQGYIILVPCILCAHWLSIWGGQIVS